MAKRVSTAQAKARLSELISRVAFGETRFVIERRGKPLAALVSINDLARLEREANGNPARLGALAVVGAWREVEDAEFDALLADIYAERERDLGRAVQLGD